MVGDEEARRRTEARIEELEARRERLIGRLDSHGRTPNGRETEGQGQRRQEASEDAMTILFPRRRLLCTGLKQAVVIGAVVFVLLAVGSEGDWLRAAWQAPLFSVPVAFLSVFLGLAGWEVALYRGHSGGHPSGGYYAGHTGDGSASGNGDAGGGCFGGDGGGGFGGSC